MLVILDDSSIRIFLTEDEFDHYMDMVNVVGFKKSFLASGYNDICISKRKN